jgi:hypothetical protein
MSDNSAFKSFSTNTGSGNFASQSFLDSNTLVAKTAFLLMVVFIFVIILNIGISLIARFMTSNDSPKLINGMVDAKQMVIFPQDPSNNNAITIYRSVNADKGIEFTWSTWIFIDNLQYLQGQYRHVFHKGNSDLKNNGMNFPNNAPGLYIAPNTNSLIVIMNTFKSIDEEIVIPNIPLNKWLNIIIRVQNSTMDVYVNGTITRSVQLAGVPKQNYGDVFVGMNGGFDGYVSNLWYYNYALGISEIQKIVKGGPNTKMIGDNGISSKLANYLSLRWFFYGSGNMYNPNIIKLNNASV